jgi:zinc protease
MQTIVEPTLAADRNGLPIWYQPVEGPVTGALTFRVGVGDEPLVRRGFSHMIQHLALRDTADPLIQCDGFVELNRTVFHATGPKENVEHFLSSVARNLSRSLRELPAGRIDAARAALAGAAKRRGETLAGELFSRRWGAQGWGTCAWGDMAIGSAREDDLEQWRRAWFSRGNAVVWMTATPSDHFALELADGSRISTPVADDLATGRFWFRHDTNAVSFMCRTTRSLAASLGADIIVEQLQHELRHDGLSHSVDSEWHRLDLRRAALVVSCDTVPGRESELAHRVIDVIERLTRGIPMELIEAVQARRQGSSTAEQVRQQLDGWSLDLLLGRARTTAAAEHSAEANVARPNIRHEIEQMDGDLLLMVPLSVGVSARDLPAYPTMSAPIIEGRRYALAHLDEPTDSHVELVSGAAGLSLDTPGKRTTVMWNHMAAVMSWHDGTRIVIDGRDQAIVVEPTRFEHGTEVVAEIDANTPPNLALTIGPRYATPVLPSASQHVLGALRRLRTGMTALLMLCIGLGPVVALLRHSPVSPMLGWFAFALGLIGTPIFAVISTRRSRPTVWDNGNRRTNVPEHVDRDGWYIPGGLLLGWAAARGHLAPSWSASFAGDLASFSSGDITGPQLYRRLGGVLADDLLDDQTNEFFSDYLGQGTRGYDVDLSRAVGSGKYFEVPDTAEVQAAVIEVVDAAHRKWRRYGRRRLLRSLRRASRLGGGGVWRGPQSNGWAEHLVQRWRKRRWT